MIYTYIFTSPIRYFIDSDEDIEGKMYHLQDLKYKFNNLNDLSNTLLSQYTRNFIDYMYHPGITSIIFKINNDELIIRVVMDLRLHKQEFDSLYTTLQAHLANDLGKKIESIPLYEFKSISSFTNDRGLIEKKPIIKKIYCLLYQQDDNWKLTFRRKED